MPDDRRSPRDSFITVYGRMPVQEVLRDPGLDVDKLVVAHGSGGHSLEAILRLAEEQRVPVEWSSAQRVKLLAGNGKHDQGIVADVEAPGLRSLEEYVAEAPADAGLLLLDGVSNPANVGMIIRTATAAGLAAVLPSHGTAAIGPLVIKASAGVAYRATIVRCRRTIDALTRLHAAGFASYGLDSLAATTLYDADFRGRCAFVLGNETDGLSPEVEARLGDLVAIPMSGGVESLNVASAAAVLAFELARRRSA
ncbi:MAG: RNA methyltransferase [Nocardioides sp.]|uniref:TrmH family RNA methyltransferase n=1 Tax=Nocardioides sp. TaxID=35761 RepID=UPI0039E5FD66